MCFLHGTFSAEFRTNLYELASLRLLAQSSYFRREPSNAPKLYIHKRRSSASTSKLLIPGARGDEHTQDHGQPPDNMTRDTAKGGRHRADRQVEPREGCWGETRLVRGG